MANYFTDEETTCKCGCGFNKPDPRLLATMNEIREACKSAVDTTSVCRCQRNNARAGGVVAVKIYKPGTKTLDLNKYPRGVRGGQGDSNHTHGTAADIKCRKIGVDALWKLIKKMKTEGRLPYLAGLGRYDTFVHVDIAPVVPGRLREW